MRIAHFRHATIVAIFIFLAVQFRVANAANTVAFSFGLNAYGRTGLGTDIGDTLIATPIDTADLTGNPAKVSAGSAFSLLLDEDGQVYSFGANDNGRTGLGTRLGDTLVATPLDATHITGKTFNQVAAGGSHSLLLADDGVVFAFGLNSNGKTGLGIIGNPPTVVATPIDTTHIASKTITQISAGLEHNLLLADDGTVFSFGYNADGRTGRGTSSGGTLIASPIDTTNLSGKTITQVAAGGFHSLLLADDGTVFSFGTNGHGQAGLGPEASQALIPTPIDLTNLAGKKVTQLAASIYHSLLLTDDGTVFSFGWNDSGQTGLGTTDGAAWIPTPINASNLADRKIIKIAAGSSTERSSLLLADDGTVFSFGSNWDGRTGLGTRFGNTLVATPIDTTNLLGYRVIDISTGSDHSLLIAVVIPEPSGTTMLLFMLGVPTVTRRSRGLVADGWSVGR